MQNGVWLHLQTSCSQVHKPSPQYANTQASLKPRNESLIDHTGWVLSPAYRLYMPHITQVSLTVLRSVAMLVSMLTGAAAHMIEYAVTILSTLVQLLAASAITTVIPLAVTMHLADVHAWQCYTKIVKRSQRLKCLISIICMLGSFMGHVISDKHCIATLTAGCMYASTWHVPAGCMFLVQIVLAFWGSVDPLMAIIENEIEDMLPQSPHCKVPHPKHANGRYWRRIRYAGRGHRQQPLKHYMSWLTLRHNNLCYLHNLMQTAERMTDEPRKRNTRQYGNTPPNNRITTHMNAKTAT